MAEPKADHDPTMEEILQSIKRIIAEDDGVDAQADAESDSVSLDDDDAWPEETAAPEPEPLKPDPVKPESVKSAKSAAKAQPISEATIDDILGIESLTETPDEGADEDAFDDVLELTEVIEDAQPVSERPDILDDIDALTRSMEAEAEATDEVPHPVADAWSAAEEEDLLEEVPALEEDAEPASPLKNLWAERMADEEEEQESLEADWLNDEVANDPLQPASAPSEGDFLSQASAAAAGAAIHHFMQSVTPRTGMSGMRETALVTRSGTTVEDLMVEALKPLLKQWLDEQLPATVERIVREELQKLIPRG